MNPQRHDPALAAKLYAPAPSQLEATLSLQMKAIGLNPEREYRFCRTRRWRFDFCWPEKMLAVEIEGGIWSSGRHVRGAGFEKDAEKYNAAALAGWTVLRFTSRMITSGEAISQIEEALNEAR